MVKLDKIYTRGGDKGYTSLGDGSRVAKHHLRIDVIGEIDEANASIGMVRLYASSELQEILSDIQHDLFDIGADLCTPFKESPKKQDLRMQKMPIERLEKTIDTFNQDLMPLTSFVLPGGSLLSAHFHMARTIVRRAERLLAKLSESEETNVLCLQYLNRLSDLLFVLARSSNNKGQMDVLWKPGKNL